ncbi:sensor histidine kinase [Methanimicrococcus blatticola]|uniref:sensor histidine kinase n=1 Tax=Methanimicrococcus blatticola TaxID=91560 RepID=UPI00105F3DEF|nr:HAMP domain-containing sensor histidine kinase [Methanimicrococcus blatticola]MBZ3935067.1 HAMP domain-containing histidine kinase [Methanimicrococcus blatticola]MCC2508836.1 HAMP domain-containing histidine kinase [Methanimicrococcus blatticola]
MAQNTKKCTAPQAFTSNEDVFDSLDTVQYSELKQLLERRSQTSFIFLHDVLNSAGGLRGFLELVVEADDPVKQKKYAENALVLCDSLIEELEYHREFLRADSNQFAPVLEKTKTKDILELTALKLKTHDVSKGRNIEIVDSPSETLVTDKVLLSRILVNMTKNAVEATEKGGSVQIGSSKHDDTIRFWVHNTAVIPEEAQAQLFLTPFSTKGNNRGIGLFSVRLLGEKALGGRVHFESTSEKGTYFCVDLPVNI